MQFALGNPPFVPDFRLSRFSLEEGKYPLAHASYFAWDLAYDFEYFCRPVDETQSLLWVRVGVTNRGDKAETAHVRVKVNFQRECDIFDDTFDETYTPFYWDQTKWRPCTIVSLKDGTLLRESTPFGKIVPNDWTTEWEESFQCTDKTYNQKYGYDRPYFVSPVMRLKDLQDVVHFSTDLKPGERRTFAPGAADELREPHARPSGAAALRRTPAGPCRRVAAIPVAVRRRPRPTRVSERELGQDLHCSATFHAPVPGPVSREGPHAVAGRKPGSPHGLGLGSNVHAPAHVAARAFQTGAAGAGFRLQPSGRRFSSGGQADHRGRRGGHHRSCAGSTPPVRPWPWPPTTPSTRATRISWPSTCPRSLRPWDGSWARSCATRKLDADGWRPPYYGLMPYGRGNDGDTGYIVTFTDAFTFWGLEKAVTLLERHRHPQAAEFRRELETYREDSRQSDRNHDPPRWVHRTANPHRQSAAQLQTL